MANSPSALKRIRISTRRREHNRAIRSRVRTLVGKFDAAVEEGNFDAAREHYNQAASALDKAAGKGIVHKNHAARRKKRMAIKLHEAN